jgi:hypothetical protein
MDLTCAARITGLHAEIITRGDEKIVAVLKADTNENLPSVDFVHFAEDKDSGEWRPTGKGFSVSTLFLSDFIQILKWAHKAL